MVDLTEDAGQRTQLQEALREVLKGELAQLRAELTEAFKEESRKQMAELERERSLPSRAPSKQPAFSRGVTENSVEGGESTMESTFRPTMPYMSSEFMRQLQEERDYIKPKKKKRRSGSEARPLPIRKQGSLIEGPPQVPDVDSPDLELADSMKLGEDALRSSELMAEKVHPFGATDPEIACEVAVASLGTDQKGVPSDDDEIASNSGAFVKTESLRPLRKAGRARGVGLSRTLSMADLDMTKWQDQLKKMVRSQWFEAAVSVVIFMSALHVGLQTDYMARNLTETAPTAYRVFDVFFCVFFAIEVACRLAAFGCQYFVMWGWAWNWFDFLLVVVQILEEITTQLMHTGLRDAGFPSAFLLRIIRVLRCVRTIRLLQVMRFADELRLLVSCIVHSLKAFSWSLALIGMLIYMASVYFTTAALDYRMHVPIGQRADDEGYNDLDGLAGSVPLAALALFQGLTGGKDWSDVSGPMMENVAWWWGPVFCLYILFMLFAVMNVVTAIFVEIAIERSEQVKQGQKLNKASRMFKCLDLDGSGNITCEEIIQHLDADHVQEFFRSIDVHATEAKCLFELLDNNGGGSLDFEEFLSGCMRLQGPARSVDLVRALNEIKRESKRDYATLG